MTLEYLKIKFSYLYDNNKALYIQEIRCEPVEFDVWIEKMVLATSSHYTNLKELGVSQLTIVYESGLKLTIKL